MLLKTILLHYCNYRLLGVAAMCADCTEVCVQMGMMKSVKTKSMAVIVFIQCKEMVKSAVLREICTFDS